VKCVHLLLLITHTHPLFPTAHPSHCTPRTRHSYPFDSRDEATGAPIFGAPVTLPPWDTALPTLLPRVVWAAGGGAVHALAATSDYLHVLALAPNASSWVHVNSTKFESPGCVAWHLAATSLSRPLASSLRMAPQCMAPRDVHTSPLSRTHFFKTSNSSLTTPRKSYAACARWGGLDSIAVVPQPGGKWTVYSTHTSGVSERSTGEIDGHTGWRDTTYYPYGGDGIYRGEMMLTTVVAFDVSNNGVADGFRNVTPAGWTGGLMGLKLGVVRHGGAAVVVAGSHTGLVFAVVDGVNSTSLTSPVAAVDAATSVLFMSTVIGASPVGYPRGAVGSGDNSGGDSSSDDYNGDSDMIIGGENGLHFVTVQSPTEPTGDSRRTERVKERRETSHESPGMAMLLRHAGPVLERGAVLSTGSTPTVSVSDWDNDGLDDVIAGSSEGRVFFTRFNATVGAFEPPIAVTVGHGDDTTDILVQGGYRGDIQGPAESRWGYTAPCVCDWNGDGLPDIISSDNSARVSVHLRCVDLTTHCLWLVARAVSFCSCGSVFSTR
jgi:hypothetical protein